jgi:hypothetical protein
MEGGREGERKEGRKEGRKGVRKRVIQNRLSLFFGMLFSLRSLLFESLSEKKHTKHLSLPGIEQNAPPG